MKRALIATVLGVAAIAAAPLSAQTISVGTASGAAGGGTTPAQIPVTFTRNAAVPVADFTARVTYNNTNFSATAAAANGGACSVNAGAGFVTVLPPPGGTDTPTNIYCNITFTITAGVAAGNYPLNVTTSFGGGGCFDASANPVACTLTPGQITVTGGGGGAVGPSIAYNPAAGAAAGTGGPVNFTGVTTVGSTGTGQIVATPSGGSGGGTTTVGSFTLSGADAANFAVTSAATLTFTAGVNTPQNINLSCTSGAAARTANLQATETITGGATTQRFWVLSCPAGAAAAVPPTITYTPAAGSSINVAAGGNTTIAVGCPTDGSACNGSGTGLAATSRLENLTVAYAGPPFSPQPSNLSCAFVTEAGGAAASPLDFVATAADSGDIRCTCANVVVAEPYTVSVSERIPANSGAVTRTFNVTCGNGLTCGSIAANPASGTVSLNNGGAAVTATTISVTGISPGINQTVTCAVSGASAGSTFAVTTVPSPLVLNSVTTSGTVSATCTNSNTTTATATLTCTSAGSAAGCPALSSTYTLSCPGQNAPPPVSTVPVPALSEQGRILLAALVLLLGVAMPLKYAAGLPEAVRIVGWAHGVFFVLFILADLALNHPATFKAIVDAVRR